MDQPTFTGALQSPFDSRDIELGKVQAGNLRPEVFLPDYSSLPMLYQNGHPACGGHMGARGAEAFEYLEHGEPIMLSARFVYALCKKIDGVAPEHGTWLRAVMKVLNEYGVCDEEYFPNDVRLPLSEYADWRRIPAIAYENAHPRVIKSYAFITRPSFEQLKEAIYRNRLVFALKKPWVPGLFDNSGHFIVLDGYDRDRIRYANSFGRTWGEEGYGWLGPASAATIVEVATAVDLPNWVIGNLKQQTFLLSRVASLFAKLLSLKRSNALPTS